MSLMSVLLLSLPVGAKGVPVKPQIEIAFEIFCEAEKRALKAGGETPRSILEFVNTLSVSKHAFATKEQEKKFYDDLEEKRRQLNSMFWTVAKEYKHTKKSLRPRRERAENDASVEAIQTKCGLSVSEKLLILSEIL